MSVRESFVKHFGEEQAKLLECAANEHDSDVHSKRGSDPFKWAILICIGYQCISKIRYRKHHGIKITEKAFKKWCLQYGELASHDGDCDYLALFCGVYQKYIPKEVLEKDKK